MVFLNRQETLVCSDNEALPFDGTGNDSRVFFAGEAEIPGSVNVGLAAKEDGSLWRRCED
jgi:hypothetical protein